MDFWPIWRKYFDFDIKGEKLIFKLNNLYHKGGAFNKINKFRAWLMCNKLRKNFSCNVYPTVKFGTEVHFVHCMGVTLGRTSVIGDYCRIYSNVVLSAKVVGDVYKSKERRHPLIGNHCILGEGCMIMGAVTVGDNCIIGARAMVTKDVPPHSVVIGVNKVRTKRPEEMEEPYHEKLEVEE